MDQVVALPTLIDIAAPLEGSDSIVLQPYKGESFCLQNFPHSPLTLPQGSQVFSVAAPTCDAIPRQRILEQSVTYLNHALEVLELKNVLQPPRLLLVLPDKTRSAIAARLLIDSVLMLKEQFPALGFTLLFGLGTHPPMNSGEIEKHLGKVRYRTLLRQNIAIHQQTTRNPYLPTQEVGLTKSPAVESTGFMKLVQLLESCQAMVHQQLATTADHSLERHLALQEVIKTSHAHLAPSIGETSKDPAKAMVSLNHRCRHTMVMPRLLWEHHLTIVAGDTDLHPYEGRGGSGGLHKMLTVALADLGTIRLSHRAHVLLDSQTRVGAGENVFVRILDWLAIALGEALTQESDSRARALPLGFSVLSLENGDVHGFWWSQKESSRQPLSAVKKQVQTRSVCHPLHLVITEAETGKGTDILAGARSLQYVADWDTQDNPILADTCHQRVALLFNPCDEPQNHGGIGNYGTKQQLQVLQALADKHRYQLRGELSIVTSLSQCLKAIQHHRRATLSRWLDHLQLVSEMDDFLDLVQDLVRLTQVLILFEQNPVLWQEELQALLSNYSNPYSKEGKAIAELLNSLLRGDSLGKIDQQLTDLRCHYHNTIGLGPGGQRALRLYRILQKFEILILATTNNNVLDFLEQLDPDLCAFLPDVIANSFRENQVSCRLLGIVGINLNEHTCQTALDYGINYTKFYNPLVANPQIGFLPQSLILRRC